MTERPRGAAALTAGIVAGLALCWAPACANVLGLDDELSDAVAEICKCNTGDDPVPQLGNTCEETLQERLATATPQTRERWLAYFVDNCTIDCSNAFACYQQDPTCSYTDCSEPRECCGFDAGNTCDNGTCVDPEGNPL